MTRCKMDVKECARAFLRRVIMSWMAKVVMVMRFGKHYRSVARKMCLLC